MADEKKDLRYDLVLMAKLNKKIDFGNSGSIIAMKNALNKQEYFKTSLKSKYLSELDNLCQSDEYTPKCIVCKKVHGGRQPVCPNCEKTILANSQSQNQSKTVNAGGEKQDSIVTKTIGQFANKVDELAGGEGKAELRVKALFSDVFKHHTTEEAERIFICGTEATTPKIEDARTDWPAPWLYTRVALWLFLAFLILEVAWDLTRNTNLLPGMMFVGSSIIPLSVVVFFFETNAPQNISIFRVILIFFVGGCASLLSTLIIFMIFPVGQLSFVGAACVGVIEEVGKMIIVALFISKLRECQYILNGLLVGSAVGAGFAVFESAGYAFRILLVDGYESMVSNINMRAVMSPGGHVAWAAISGAAIMIALKGEKFRWDVLKSARFWGLFIIPIILHSIWDMPIGLFLVYPALILTAWITLLVLIQNGLKEISRKDME